jgi:hypothetical protein
MAAETTEVRYVLRGERVILHDASGGVYAAPAPADGLVLTFTRCGVEHTYYVPLSAITAAIDARGGAGLRMDEGRDA